MPDPNSPAALSPMTNSAQSWLWPQSERIKAAAGRHRRFGAAAKNQGAALALAGLEQYYAVPTLGLWRDKHNPDGSCVLELTPASSLYHIACAFAESAGA